MDKLTDVIETSCKKLHTDGLLTEDQLRRCINNFSNENIDVKKQENDTTIKKIYTDPIQEFTNDQLNIYLKYKKIVDSNMNDLKKAIEEEKINTSNSNRDKIKIIEENIESIKHELNKLIQTYESNTNKSKGDILYKEMILKNKELADKIKKVSKQNEVLQFYITKNTIGDTDYKNTTYFYTILIVIISLSVLFILYNFISKNK